MKIEVGDYVRTPEQGFIGKLVEINKDVLNYYKIDVGREIRRTNGMSDNYIYSRDGFGLKHSKNIIDLIVESDVIKLNDKKYEVIFDKSYEKLGLLIPNREHLAIRHCSLEYIFSNEGIKEFESISIITKEQIEQIEYRIKE